MFLLDTVVGHSVGVEFELVCTFTVRMCCYSVLMSHWVSSGNCKCACSIKFSEIDIVRFIQVTKFVLEAQSERCIMSIHYW